MTTIITRLYSDKATAEAVVTALKAIGLNDDEVAMIDGSDAAGRLTALRVAPADAARLAALVAQGHPAVVAAAPFNPRGIALKATRLMDAHHPAAGAERYIVEDFQTVSTSNLYPEGTYFMSVPPKFSGGMGHGHALTLWGLVSRPRSGRSAIAGGRFMSRMLLPFPLLKRKSGGLSVVGRRGWQLSRMFGIPTVTGPLRLS